MGAVSMPGFYKKFSVFLIAAALSLASWLPLEAAQAPKSPSPKANAASPKYILPLGKEFFYSLTWDGKILGFSRFKVSKLLRLGGEIVYVIDSESRIKVGSGKIEENIFASKLMVNQKDLLPSYFHSLQKSSGGEIFIECIMSSSMAAQKTASSKNSQESFYPLKGPSGLFFANLWGRFDTLVEHYWLLGRKTEKGEKTLAVYDPTYRKSGNLLLKPVAGGRDEKRVLMHDYAGLPFMEIRLDQKTGELVKIEMPGGFFRAQRSNAGIIKAYRKAAGINLSAYQTVQSSMYFTNPHDLVSLKADISALVSGTPVTGHEAAGFSQEFQGEVSGGLIKGVYSVKVSEYEPGNPPSPFPPRDLSPELSGYLKADFHVESDDEEIKTRAMEITWRARDSWDAARKIGQWVYENIDPGSSFPSARLALQNRKGNSEARADLFAALCRAAGIPARVVGGVMERAGEFVPHSWIEVNFGQESWIPMDASTGEFGKIGATHIALREGGDLERLALSVLDFAPRPPARTAYFKRELTWPVGEERVYSICQNGVEIGRETACNLELLYAGGGEAFRFEDQVRFSLAGIEFAGQGSCLVTSEGLPLEFKAQNRVNDRVEDYAYLFKDGLVHQTVTVGSKTVQRQLPYSLGMYLADQRYLSQLILAVGQVPTFLSGSHYTFEIFIPQELSQSGIDIEVKGKETVNAGEKEYSCFKIESARGMLFWMTGEGLVVKLLLPDQGLELKLVDRRVRRP
jgi:transglutaminase-like putative cysteine protease